MQCLLLFTLTIYCHDVRMYTQHNWQRMQSLNRIEMSRQKCFCFFHEMVAVVQYGWCVTFLMSSWAGHANVFLIRLRLYPHWKIGELGSKKEKGRGIMFNVILFSSPILCLSMNHECFHKSSNASLTPSHIFFPVPQVQIASLFFT